MPSRAFSERWLLDLARDVPTTPDDVRALRALRMAALHWFALSVEELEALLPQAALDRRPAHSSDLRPFTLPALEGRSAVGEKRPA
jgi:hypothetical protein